MSSPKRLAMCPGCARHVRVDEPRCPFCEVLLSGLVPAPDMPPSMRLSRRSMFALSASISALIFAPAVAQAHSNVLAQRGAQRRPPGWGMGHARYGVPPMPQPAYGVSPITPRAGTVTVSDVRVNGAVAPSNPWTSTALGATNLLRRRYASMGAVSAGPSLRTRVEISVAADGSVRDVRVTGTGLSSTLVELVAHTYHTLHFAPGAAGTVQLTAVFRAGLVE